MIDKRKRTTKYTNKKTSSAKKSSARRKISGKKKKIGSKNINISNICIALIALAAVILIFVSVTLVKTLSYDRIYEGIYINDTNVSHMTKEELHQYLEETYGKPLDSSVLSIYFSDYLKWELKASDLNIEFNIDAIVEAVYSHGHTGNIFKRLGEINSLKNNNIHINVFEEEFTEPLVSYNEDVVDQLVDDIIYNSTCSPVQHSVEINYTFVNIVAGSNGYTFTEESVKSAILSAINSMKLSSIDIKEYGEATAPAELDIDEIAAQINKEPVNASYHVEDDRKTLTIKPFENGFSVDKADLQDIAQKLSSASEGDTFRVNITILEPKIKSLDMPTFNDILGTGSTDFSTGSSSKNRNKNLEVATETLDGYILLPGEQFSFNTYVGDTTKEKGYLPAAGYAGGRVVDTYGGGICQVSTTLYNAVINSVNVDVDVRYNHSSTVSYVPFGLDCMINYGTNDFKFTNNTNYPIMIEGIYDKTGTLTYNIRGVDEYDDIKYLFISTEDSVTKYKTVYTTDRTQLQSGKNGGKYTVTRVTLKNGVEIAREEFSKSTYRAMDRVVLDPSLVTPKPSTPTPEPDITPTPTITPANTPFPGQLL